MDESALSGYSFDPANRKCLAFLRVEIKFMLMVLLATEALEREILYKEKKQSI